MKKILFLIFILLNFSYANSLGLTKTDLLILNKIKSLTDDPMMKYTLMAIAIKESGLGRKQINAISNDYGLFQSNIKSVLRRQQLPDTLNNRRYFAYKLLSDVGFATANAIVEIDYWKEVHGNNWIKIWASYNTGWRYQTVTGYVYSASVFNIVKKLKFEYGL